MAEMAHPLPSRASDGGVYIIATTPLLMLTEAAASSPFAFLSPHFTGQLHQVVIFLQGALSKEAPFPVLSCGFLLYRMSLEVLPSSSFDRCLVI